MKIFKFKLNDQVRKYKGNIFTYDQILDKVNEIFNLNDKSMINYLTYIDKDGDLITMNKNNEYLCYLDEFINENIFIFEVHLNNNGYQLFSLSQPIHQNHVSFSNYDDNKFRSGVDCENEILLPVQSNDTSNDVGIDSDYPDLDEITYDSINNYNRFNNLLKLLLNYNVGNNLHNDDIKHVLNYLPNSIKNFNQVANSTIGKVENVVKVLSKCMNEQQYQQQGQQSQQAHQFQQQQAYQEQDHQIQNYQQQRQHYQRSEIESTPLLPPMSHQSTIQ